MGQGSVNGVSHAAPGHHETQRAGVKEKLGCCSAIILPVHMLERACKVHKRDKNLFTTKLWVRFGYKEQFMQVTIEFINVQHIFLLQVSPGPGGAGWAALSALSAL